MALDLIEPVRPLVDRFVLGLVAERSFKKRDFVERSDGHVRVAAPLTHELAATLPTWRRAIAAYAESVAHVFTDHVAGKLAVTTPLTGAKGRVAAADVKRRKAKSAREQIGSEIAGSRALLPKRRLPAASPERAATLFAACVDCGGPLARSRHVRCPACWERQPGQSRESRKRRGRSIAMARSELERWKAEHPHVRVTPEEFRLIRENLANVTLSAIMEATGCSRSAASQWRSGRYVPALRHWDALAELAGTSLPQLGSDAAPASG